MLLHGKPAIRRLHPESAPHPRHLAREALLAGGVADVLDHRIAEDHVEGLVTKRQPATVSRHPLGRARQVGAGPRHVQQDQARLHRNHPPIVRRAAHIQHARLPADRELPHKALHAPAAETPREPFQRGEWRRHSYILPRTAASNEIRLSSRMEPVARCSAALAFTYELCPATSVDFACASRLAYWMTKKLVEEPTSNFDCSASSDSFCRRVASVAAW